MKWHLHSFYRFLKPKYFWLVASLILLALHLFFIVEANRDLASNPSFLFMDEQITFSGTHHILHPSSFGDFVKAVIDGGDQRYGRILWNTMALFSALPDRIWGDTGLIISNRMVQAVQLIIAYLIFAFGLTRAPMMKFFCLGLLLVLPYTGYYSTIPKPEPNQLLYLALFFLLHKKAQCRFGFHWILMGLAFGAKISTLPIAVLCVVHSGYLFLRYSDVKPIRQFLAGLVAFFIGFGLAVPSLLLSFALRNKTPFSNYWWWITNAPFHPADDMTVTAIDWLKYIAFHWSAIPSHALIPLLFFFALAIFAPLCWHRSLDHKSRDQFTLGWLVMCSGIFLNVLVIWKVKRVWGFYLHSGFALGIVGVMMLGDVLLTSTFGFFGRFSSGAKNAFQGATILAVSLVIGFRMSPTLNEYRYLAARTAMPDHQAKVGAYDFLTAILPVVSALNGRRLLVFVDVFLYVPPSDNQFSIVPVWSPLPWARRPDIILVERNSLNAYTTPNSEIANVRHYDSIIAQYQYSLHTGPNCDCSLCYQEVKIPMNPMVLLIRKDIKFPALGNRWIASSKKID